MDRPLLIVLTVLISVAILIVVVILSLIPPPDVLVGNLALEPVQEGLASPVAFAFAPDGRIFINEIQGDVRIVKDGSLLPTPFVSVDVLTQGERGLLGLALHPNFAAEPYVYVYYSYQGGGGPFNRISRFPDLGDVAGAEEILLDRIPSGNIHNSGRLQFGPDGMLYVSIGDTGNRNQAQDVGTIPGSILRMHPDGALPADNPFPGSYIYLYGIRNVFGLQFTPGGVLLFTDNGQSRNDEVNRGTAGGNYGWPVVQGDQTDPAFVSPLVVF
ncbi:MAG: PQQ-dependent sugar dehydrogenase, partial [Thermoplasmata archaeon]